MLRVSGCHPMTKFSYCCVKRTILKGEIALKSVLDREMSADQLFERTAGSTPASLSCARGYESNMAPRTVKGSIRELWVVSDI